MKAWSGGGDPERGHLLTRNRELIGRIGRIRRIGPINSQPPILVLLNLSAKSRALILAVPVDDVDIPAYAEVLHPHL